jgi:hypothetical protein
MSDSRPSTSGRDEVATGSAVPVGQLVQNWRDAHERALAYAAALGVPEGERLALDAVQEASARAWTPWSNVVAATLDVLRRRLAGSGPQAFLRWRLARTLGASADVDGIAISPPLRRQPMRYEPMGRRLRDRIGRRRVESRREAEAVLYGNLLRRLRRPFGWTRVAHWRRLLLVLLVLVPTSVASAFMMDVLPHQGRGWLELVIVVFFGLLFGWVSVGFWTSLFGFVTLVRGRDRFAITGLAEGAPLAPGLSSP